MSVGITPAFPAHITLISKFVIFVVTRHMNVLFHPLFPFPVTLAKIWPEILCLPSTGLYRQRVLRSQLTQMHPVGCSILALNKLFISHHPPL